jgi:prepilin-type N-terminal cleavage/methylation domain-containing protein
MTGRRGRPSAAAGFTLVEMMTVVVIIGILAAIAMAWLSNPTDVETATRSAASAIGESARLAVKRGPLPAEIVAATGNSNRVRVTVSATAPPVFTIALQLETGPATAAFFDTERIVMPNNIVLGGYANEADLTGGATQVTGSDAVFECSSNGQCDPKTIYVSQNSGNDKYRIVIMPLSTAPQVYPGW